MKQTLPVTGTAVPGFTGLEKDNTYGVLLDKTTSHTFIVVIE